MKKSLLAVMLVGILLMQSGCGTKGTDDASGQMSVAVQQTKANQNVSMYITEVLRSFKGISGYVDEPAGRKDYETQTLADECRFYNYEGERIAFSELAQAVDTYMKNSTKGVLCEVQYSGNSIVSIKISDKEADIANTATIQPTLYYHMTNMQEQSSDTSIPQKSTIQTETGIFSKIVENLKNEEAYAFADIGLEKQVMLVAPSVYADKNGSKLAIISDVYYVADGSLKNAGTVRSTGTAYPIAYDASGIYVGGNHEIQRFNIDVNSGKLQLKEAVYVTYDEDGKASYTKEEDGETQNVTEKEYTQLMDKYSKATTANYTGSGDVVTRPENIAKK
ncbi:MAG: hypothetical protein ACI4EJ_10985 [Bacteroides sp.]